MLDACFLSQDEFSGSSWADQELNSTTDLGSKCWIQKFPTDPLITKNWEADEILLKLILQRWGGSKCCHPQTPGQAGAEGKQRDSAWLLHWWSQQSAGVTGSRLDIQWPFTVLTYTAQDSQTSDYRANKYEEVLSLTLSLFSKAPEACV